MQRPPSPALSRGRHPAGARLGSAVAAGTRQQRRRHAYGYVPAHCRLPAPTPPTPRAPRWRWAASTRRPRHPQQQQRCALTRRLLPTALPCGRRCAGARNRQRVGRMPPPAAAVACLQRSTCMPPLAYASPASRWRHAGTWRRRRACMRRLPGAAPPRGDGFVSASARSLSARSAGVSPPPPLTTVRASPTRGEHDRQRRRRALTPPPATVSCSVAFR